MILAGAAAIHEIDIKKVIALSTLSQLGVIMITLGGLEPILSFFHLLRHAYFKAILFICAGIIIHNIKDYQDIRKIRIILNILPITFRVIIVANLRLCGLPFLRGFYSKDIILEVIIISTISLIIFVIILVATFFTVAYSCRMSFLLASLYTAKNCTYISDDNDYLMINGIIFLFPFSIVGGINII
jgi:NADH-ubiquinone oxidoreductase chain 5